MTKFIPCGGIAILCALMAETAAARVAPLGTAFTYQGVLKLSGDPINATADFQFTLFDALIGPNQIGVTQNANNISLTDGLFTVQIDFGFSAFAADARFLEIAVRSPAGGGPFTTLAPRQPLTATPFALQTRGIVVDSLNHVGIGDTSPAALFTVGNGDQFQIASSGDVTFLNDVASITFPVCDAVNQPMIQMFAGGGGNADRMVIAHSASFPDWGLQYQDVGDRFRFLNSGDPVLTIDLTDGGDLSFADDQGSINFPAASGATAPMIHMFTAPGTGSRMVLAHSPTFDNWGLQYDDLNDRFNFLGAGFTVLSVDLFEHSVGINTIPDPFYALHVDGNSNVEGVMVATAPTGSEAMNITTTDSEVAVCRRFGTDGNLIIFNKSGVSVGSISVAGGVVSYNAFTGSHFAWTDHVIDRAMLVRLTGINRRSHSSADGEVVYGIAPTAIANDSHCLGAYLGLREPSQPADDDNPHLVMAVGNGDMWVSESSTGNIQPGDYLISSDIAGCAMKDDPTRFPLGYIVARAGQPVDWSSLDSPTDGSPKRQKISVFFESFVRDSRAADLAAVVEQQNKKIAALEAQLRSLQSLADRLTQLEARK